MGGLEFRLIQGIWYRIRFIWIQQDCWVLAHHSSCELQLAYLYVACGGTLHNNDPVLKPNAHTFTFQSDNSHLKCLLQAEHRVWRLGSDLISPHGHVYMRYLGVMIKYIPPRWSLQVDAGVVVGWKSRWRWLCGATAALMSQRQRREVHAV